MRLNMLPILEGEDYSSMMILGTAQRAEVMLARWRPCSLLLYVVDP